jgi:hypothetical protein
VEGLVNKALQKSPSRRHLTIRQFLRELEAVSAAEVILPRATVPPRLHTPVHGITALTDEGKPPSSEIPARTEEPMRTRTVSDVRGERPAGGFVPHPSAVETVDDRDLRDDEPPAPARAQPAGKEGAFRETMWFYKGEVEDEGSAIKSSPTTEKLAQPDELARQYADDGSMTRDEADRLSLRTGNTHAMKVAEIPNRRIGRPMDTKEVLVDINRKRTLLIWVLIGAGVLVAGAGVALYFLVLS